MKSPRFRSKTSVMRLLPDPLCRAVLASSILSPVGSSGAFAQSAFTVPQGAPLQAPFSQSPGVPAPAPNMKAGEGALVARRAMARRRRHQRRTALAGLCRQAGPERRVPTAQGGPRAQPTFVLPAGSYVVHVAFGLASAAKAVQVAARPCARCSRSRPAGLRIEGRVGNAKIPTAQISFDIYKGSQFEPGDRRPIATSVQTGDVVLVPEGTYYIVSKYGDGNAVVRSDIRVQAGKLTDVTVTHRAALITLKLVSKRGGEALANTDWSVLTPGRRHHQGIEGRVPARHPRRGRVQGHRAQRQPGLPARPHGHPRRRRRDRGAGALTVVPLQGRGSA